MQRIKKTMARKSNCGLLGVIGIVQSRMCFPVFSQDDVSKVGTEMPNIGWMVRPDPEKEIVTSSKLGLFLGRKAREVRLPNSGLPDTFEGWEFSSLPSNL
jgi:hypothetical protein